VAFENILLDITDGVAVLTLNRPQALNALTLELIAECQTVLDQIEGDTRAARCLLITGAGRGFSSGADLASGMGAKLGADFDAGHVLEIGYNPLLERLMALPVPIVTAVNGAAAGAGCSLAVAGDIVIAGRSAYFLQAFVNIGLVPDVGSSWMLPRLIGKQRAQAMMMLGEKVPAETALDWGMVYKVVEDADLLPTAMAIARKFAAGPTVAYNLIRIGIRQALESSLSDVLNMERANQRIAGHTADFNEGVTAFLQKRPAQFQGK
jgi:2-(1,2-epoxy-1,2-dihydrophenyl)acetyl-CoA isomerase